MEKQGKIQNMLNSFDKALITISKKGNPAKCNKGKIYETLVKIVNDVHQHPEEIAEKMKEQHIPLNCASEYLIKEVAENIQKSRCNSKS